MKKALLMATGAAVAAGFAAGDAQAVDAKAYGWVNKTLMVYDDGASTEFNIADNDRWSTRFGFKGSQKLENGLTAGIGIEYEVESNDSNKLTQKDIGGATATPDSTTATFKQRKAVASLGGNFGAVMIGHTQTATDLVTEMNDMAGVFDVFYSRIESLGGGLKFRDTSAATLSTVTIGAAADNFDGNGRKDVIRYDSPWVNGIQGRISAAQGGDVDASVWYKGNVQDLTVKAALGYTAYGAQSTGADKPESQTAGSIGVKHKNGLAGTFAFGSKELTNKTAGTDDPSSYYTKVGYAWDKNEVAVDYSNNEGVITDGTNGELTALGLGAQHNLGNGVSVAAYYRTYEYDDNTATPFDDISVYGVNLMVRF